MRKLSVMSHTGSIEIPKIILGSTFFGTKIDEKTSFELMDRYAEMGGFCIDTASVYGDFDDAGVSTSEIVIGKWLKQSRHGSKFKIITKGAHHRFETPTISRVTAQCIEEDIEKSLRSLDIDVIDIYFLHRDNVNVPVSEIMPVLDRYVKAGKIRAIGASNWSPERILEANNYAVNNGLTLFTVSEIQWSLAQINPKHNFFSDLPHMTRDRYSKYMDMKIPILGWSSQAAGIVSKVIDNGWDGIDEQLRKSYYNEINVRKIRNVMELLSRKGITATQAALGYITCNPLSAAAIIGPSSIGHLNDSMSAADLELSIDEINLLDQTV